VGPPNTGKSGLFKILTGLETKTSLYPFSTTEPKIGTFKFEDAKIQIIDMPSFPNHDRSLINSSDTLIVVVENLKQIVDSKEIISKAIGKRILVYNKEDLLSNEEKRKIEATIKSKFGGCNFILFSEKSLEKINELKEKIFSSFPIIRVYTKEPKKEPSAEPMILNKGSLLKDAVEKIRKGMSGKIKMSRIWGPSSKFGGQVIGLEHKLKDKDIIEFKTE